MVMALLLLVVDEVEVVVGREERVLREDGGCGKMREGEGEPGT